MIEYKSSVMGGGLNCRNSNVYYRYPQPYTICWCGHSEDTHHSPFTDRKGIVTTEGCDFGEVSRETNCMCFIFYPKECSETTYNRLNYAVHRGITIWKLWDAFEFQRRETKEN